MNLEKIQKILAFQFKNPALLEQALTHKSYAIEKKLNYHNEKLEFLGDSVLSLIVATYLFKNFHDIDESEMSKMRAILVSRNSLSQWAKELHINDFVLLSRVERANKGYEKDSILANCLESILGAMYIDSGFDAVKEFVTNYLNKKKFPIEDTDYKTRLQEIAQKKFKSLPIYTVIDEKGPEHDKRFVIEVRVGNILSGKGKGRTKKEAEQRAAFSVLKHLLKTE